MRAIKLATAAAAVLSEVEGLAVGLAVDRLVVGVEGGSAILFLRRRL